MMGCTANQVIAEHNGATGSQLVRYVYAGSRMIAKVEGATTRYFISDRLSARLVLDVYGNVAGKQSHLPFGEEIGGTGEQQKQHFTSYERDAETGTDYAMNRHYNQSTGRFNRPDPLRESAEAGAPQTWNRYSYTINDPINLKDPTGLLLSIAIEYNSCFGVNQLLGPIGGLELGFPVSCGPSVPGPPPEQKKVKCGDIVKVHTDPGQRKAVAVVLGEATPLYRLGQAKYRDDDAFNQPTGEGTIELEDYMNEALAFVSGIANVANDRRASWNSVITQSRYHGLSDGLILLERYQRSLIGSRECTQLIIALSGVTEVSLHGPQFDFRYWVGVFNSGYRGGRYVRIQGNATRIADTDFSATVF